MGRGLIKLKFEWDVQGNEFDEAYSNLPTWIAESGNAKLALEKFAENLRLVERIPGAEIATVSNPRVQHDAVEYREGFTGLKSYAPGGTQRLIDVEVHTTSPKEAVDYILYELRGVTSIDTEFSPHTSNKPEPRAINVEDVFEYGRAYFDEAGNVVIEGL